MNEQNKHIDDIFRDALGNYAETPPAAVWNDIEQRLPATTPKRRSRFGGWMWGIVLLLLVGSGLLVARKMLHKDDDTDKKQIAQPIPTAHPENNNTITNGTNTTTTNNQPTTTNNTPVTAAPNTANPGTQATSANAQPIASGTVAGSSTHSTSTTSSSNPTATTGSSSAAATTHSGARQGSGHNSRRHMQRHTNSSNAATTPQSPATAAAKTRQAHHTSNGNHRHRTAKNTTAQTPNTLIPAPDKNKQTNTTASSNPQPAKKHHQRNSSTPAVAGTPSTTIGTPVATTPKKHRKAHNIAPATNTNNTVAAVTPARHKKHKQSAATTNNTTTTPAIAAQPAKPKHKKAPAAITTAPAVATTPAIKPHRKKAATTMPATIAATSIPRPHHKKQAPSAPIAQLATTPAQPKKKHKALTPAPTVAAIPKKEKSQKVPAVKPQKQATTPAVARGKQKAAKQKPAAPVPAATNPVVANPRPATQSATTTTFPKQSKITDPNDKPFLKQPTQSDNGSDNTAGGGSGGSGGGGDKPAKERKPIHLNFDAGVFAGYEKGFSSFNVDKSLFGAYLHYHFTAKLGLMVPPSYKFGNFNSSQLASSGTYYDVQNSSFSQITHPHDSTQQNDTVIYYYSQSHDSIRVNSVATRKIWEVDLPLLLTYQISPSLSVFAGPVLSFGNQIKITNAITHNLLQFSTVDSTFVLPGTPLLDSSSFAALVSHSGLPYSSSDSTNVQNATTNPLRIGYMLGLQFTTGSFNFNLSVQQSLSGTSQILNPDIKKAYTQPYFRATLGYRILKGRQRKTQAQMEQEREDEYHRIQ